MSLRDTYDGKGRRFWTLRAKQADVLTTGKPSTPTRLGVQRSSPLGVCLMPVGTMYKPVTRTSASLAHSAQKWHPYLT